MSKSTKSKARFELTGKAANDFFRAVVAEQQEPTPTQVTSAVLQLSNEDLALIRSALQHYGLAKESEARIEQYALEHNFLNANGLKPSQAVVDQRLEEAERARQLIDWFEASEEEPTLLR